MNHQVLIDSIVRQTMVLIAQISTADGGRSPLSHIADETFMSLIRELEGQGVGKPVIADMFGLALRSYRQKVQRLSESVTARGATLWGAVHGFLAKRESATRSEVLAEFKNDEEKTLRSILNDLVESGLICRAGRGAETRFRVATAEELEELGASGEDNSQETNAALVWVYVYRASPIRKDSLTRVVPLPAPIVEEALQNLLADGRIRLETRTDGVYCATERCLIPVGQAAGWEAAIIDHHRAVLNALAAKFVSGKHVSAAQDEVGGSTVSFDLWPGHPREREVRQLLATVRSLVFPLWEEVVKYDEGHRPEVTYKVTFYCGQSVCEGDGA